MRAADAMHAEAGAFDAAPVTPPVIAVKERPPALSAHEFDAMRVRVGERVHALVRA